MGEKATEVTAGELPGPGKCFSGRLLALLGSQRTTEESEWPETSHRPSVENRMELTDDPLGPYRKTRCVPVKKLKMAMEALLSPEANCRPSGEISTELMGE